MPNAHTRRQSSATGSPAMTVTPRGGGVKPAMNRANTRKPVPTSSSVTASAGLWLTPPAQRTKSMPIGAISMSAMPSWPAPEGRCRTSMPSAAMAEAICCCMAAAHGAVFASHTREDSSTMLRRAAIAANSARIASTASPRFASVGARTSTLNVTLPGNHVHGAGLRVDAAHGADHVGTRAREPLDGEDALGGGRERVAA